MVVVVVLLLLLFRLFLPFHSGPTPCVDPGATVGGVLPASIGKRWRR